MNKKISNLLLAIVAIIWGMSFAFQKSLLEHMGPAVFNFYNFGFCAFILFLILIWRREDLLYRWREGLVLGACLAALELFQMYGLKYSSAANTVFISNMGMLIIPLVGFVLFKHRFKKENFVALALATLGMYYLVGGIDRFNFGDILLLISAFAMAFYFLYSEKFEQEKSDKLLTLLFQSFFVSSLIFLITALILGETFYIKSGFRFELLWQIVLFTFLPYSFVQIASKKSDDMGIAIYDGVLEPMTGAIVAWVWFKEAANTENVIGCLIMILSFVFTAIFTRKHFILKRK